MHLKNRVITFSLLVVLFLFVAIYYGAPLRGGLAFYSADISHLNYAVARDYTDEIKSGQYNLWEPSIFLGNYRAANPVLGLYSPRLLFYFIFPDYTAQTACLFFLFLASGLGAFLLGFSITKSRSAGLFMGVVYAGSGFIASMHFNIPYLSAAWFPWVFWSYERLRAGRGHGWLIGFFLALIGLDGDIIGCFVTLACLWVFFFLGPHPGSGRRRQAGVLLLTSILGVALLGIILVPALEVMAESQRGTAIPYDIATLFSMHPLRMLNLLSPALWGEYFNNSFWGQHLTSSYFDPCFWMDSIYIGLIPLVCIGLAIFDRESRSSIRAPLLLALVLLFFSFGKYTPIYALSYNLIPGLDRFRYPAKFYAWVSFFLIWCSAVGFAKFTSISMSPLMERTRSKGMAGFFIIALSVVLGYALLNQNLLNHPPENIDRYLFLLKRDSVRLALAAVIIPLMLRMQSRGRSKLIPSALIGLTMLDLAFGAPYYSRVSQDMLDRPSTIGMVLSYMPDGRLLRPKNIENFCPKGARASLKHNWGLLEGVDYVFGYGPTIPQRFDPIMGDNFFPKFRHLSRIMAIRYVISSIDPGVIEVSELHSKGDLDVELFFQDDNLVLLSHGNPYPQFLITRGASWVPSKEKALEMIFQEDDGPLVLEKQEAFFKGKPVSPAPSLNAKMEGEDEDSMDKLDIQRPSNDEIEVRANLKNPGLLVVREGLGKGWKVWVNEKPAILYRADYFGAAVELPEGSSHVRFYFSPGGYYIGVLVTVLSLVLLLGWMLLSKRSVRKSS